ncbi:uncharacterized protein LOC119572507 [Penaeus monodon]|uniref:uncharacterized protein LOC119572507 n=1 Tax=Penaeus monodon TaxID=6687 RepID=UPI0018A79F86|nr:uncharacterized protein LOC119572507 [Penaeus monodon]
MVISNTIFTKRQEHLITYKSGRRASQIDYLLYRRRNMVEIINCKVIPGDHVTNQHRLVVMDLNIKVSRVHSTPKPGPKKCNRLKDQKKKKEFKERVLGQISQEIEDLNSWWNETAEFVIRAGKEILGETSGKIWKDKETWWFNDEVQQQMKDENGNIIRTEQGNIKRWEEYFSKLLNEENERLIRGDGDANQGAVLEISRIEVQQALKKMKNGKATGPDGIPIEAWKAMGEEGIDVLWMLMGKVMDEENIPTVWKESILIPIFKRKEMSKIVKIIEA